MSKSFRVSVVFAGLVTVMLGVSQVAFAGTMVTQSKEQAAGTENSKSAGPTKSSKKKKKKKTEKHIHLAAKGSAKLSAC